jgi:predicted solute-binding protein
MPIKVGRVPYLDCEPFYFDMARRGIETYEMVPSQLAPAAEKGEIDAGPVPLVDCFRLEDRFQPVSGFCIASTQRAGSIFLYSK